MEVTLVQYATVAGHLPEVSAAATKPKPKKVNKVEVAPEKPPKGPPGSPGSRSGNFFATRVFIAWLGLSHEMQFRKLLQTSESCSENGLFSPIFCFSCWFRCFAHILCLVVVVVHCLCIADQWNIILTFCKS